MSLDDFAATNPAGPVPSRDPQILTISDLNKKIRQSLENEFPLVWIKGEISNFKPHTSGHFYFSLKDDTAQVSAVMFRGFNQRLKFKPENGMEVVVRGRVTVYEPRGSYQIFCEIMEPVGLGALQMAFEQLKAKLKAEGLFDPARKKPLPPMPTKIAIVTSPTGAAIRDMLNILSRRGRGLEITIIPAVVQGAQAPADIIKGIQLAQKIGGYDVLIVGRGGGSMEDLWGFNDEGVVRAIASCTIPTISAVGHEVDFTIADFVADLRAPTPSAAAELVVKNAADLVDKIRMLKSQLQMLALKRIELDRKHVAALSKGVIDPKRRLQDLVIRLDELMQRLELAAFRGLEEKRQVVELLRHKLGEPEARITTARTKLEQLNLRLNNGAKQSLERKTRVLARVTDLLDSLSPLKVVARGYSLVTRENELVKDVSMLKAGDLLNIKFAKGSAQARVEKISKD